jgi:hypothetical protein
MKFGSSASVFCSCSIAWSFRRAKKNARAKFQLVTGESGSTSRLASSLRCFLQAVPSAPTHHRNTDGQLHSSD